MNIQKDSLSHSCELKVGRFRAFATKTASVAGSQGAFIVAILFILIWLATGPLFHFSDTWQLVINTSTTIITFLMVFLIQATQNRDSKALHLKLDELIRAQGTARNTLIDLENSSDEEIDKIQQGFNELLKKEKLGHS